MRISEHPILQFNRGEKVTFFFNGAPVEGYTGETIAAALHAAGIRELGHSQNVRVCITKVKADMDVREQEGKGVVQHD